MILGFSLLYGIYGFYTIDYQRNRSFYIIMSINKTACIVAFIVTILGLIISLVILPFQDTMAFYQWLENVCVGVFASGLLMLFSSFIGYRKEEMHTFREYHWKLSELKKAAVALETLPAHERDIDNYIDATLNLNNILRNYFAIVDIDFALCNRRKKVQKLYEIHQQLEKINTLSGNALLKMYEFRCGKLNDEGARNYSFKQFKHDIQDFINAIDNYNESGLMLAIWLEKKELEYGEVVFGYDSVPR
jgi:hypothetical protein